MFILKIITSRITNGNNWNEDEIKRSNKNLPKFNIVALFSKIICIILFIFFVTNCVIHEKIAYTNSSHNISFFRGKNNTLFDIVIPISSNSFIPFSLGIYYFKKMMEFYKNKIVVICSRDLFYNITTICEECVLINENEVFENLNLANIQQLLPSFKERASWYFQQFLKMAYYNITKNDYYLVWDSDTILLNNISFFNPINNKPYFTMKKEYHKSYFETLNIILRLDKINPKSFISEHMLINKYVMKEMINKIEMNKNLKGNNFFEKIINSIKPKNIFLGFSEYESYGTYIYKYYRNEYGYRSLRTCRHGYSFIDLNFSSEILDWVSKSFDTISFEGLSIRNNIIIDLIKIKSMRDKYEFKDIISNLNYDNV